MTDHHSVSYADRAWHGTVVVDENVLIARDTFLLRFDCPEIAATVLPGQFVMIRLAGGDDPLLGRAFAVYKVVSDSEGAARSIDIVYLAVGRMTRRLVGLQPGEQLDVWGPLGNGFPPTAAEHLIMVAGGIGQTPFLTLAEEYLGLRTYGDPPRQVSRAAKVTLCYGARNRDYFACLDDFQQAGVEIQLATEDGSAGHHGLVTDLVPPVVAQSTSACRIVCCGPEPMMEATAKIARKLAVPCQVSLETPMACGLGICFSCVAKIRDASGQWEYRRTCVEGPVFDAENVDFEQ